MKKGMEKVGSIALMLLYMGILFGNAFDQSDGKTGKEQEVAEVFLAGENQAADMGETEERQTERKWEKVEEEETEEGQETEEITQILSAEEEQKIVDSTWANTHRSRIAYMDGYYYYSSQLDHYYLYRVKEDGSEPQCMAKIHPGSICTQDGYIYFINQSDGHGIYRIKADGTGMEKLCEDGHNLQVSEDYLFFCSSAYEETLETTGIIVEGQKNGGLYRMKKDGSERKLIAEDVWDYLLSDGYSQETQNMDVIYYSKTEENGMTVYKMDINGQEEEELCRFEVQGNLAVFGGHLYCIGEFYDDREKLTRICLESGETSSFVIPEYKDCCIYKGYFYGLCGEKEGEEQQRLWIYRMNLRDLGNKSSEMLYEDRIACESWHEGIMSDLYTTEKGVFFRRFVSEEKGCLWFQLTEDEDVQEFEDRETIPAVLSAKKVDYGELLSVKLVLKDMCTEGYEIYLSDSLKYKEYFSVDKDGEPANCFWISLPQFNSSVAGYQKINLYFQNLYKEALKERDAFSQSLDQKEPQNTYNYQWFLNGFHYIYIGEKYITVEQNMGGYPGGGIHNDTFSAWITFDRESGDWISLEEILGMTSQEAAARLTGAVYKYMERERWSSFFLREGNLLTNEFDPENFLLFSDGVGIYYPRYAIECGAAGDFLFIVPWEDLTNGTEEDVR